MKALIKAKIYWNLIKIWFLKKCIECGEVNEKDNYKAKAKNEKNKHQEKKKIEQEDIAGEYKTIKQLLDDLDIIFKDLKGYKSTQQDTDIPRYMKNFGVFMMNIEETNRDYIHSEHLDGWNVRGFPLYIGTYFPDIDIDKKTGVETLGWVSAAQRVDKLPLRPKEKGYTYYQASYMTKFNKLNYVSELPYHIRVDEKTGEVEALPMCFPATSRIKKKTVKSNKKNPRTGTSRGTFETIQCKKWDYPREYMNAFSTCDNESYYDDLHNDVKKILERRFILSFNLNMKREYGVNINIKKGKQRVTVIVPQHRWKYFFKDRISAKATKTGRKAPIFHAVVAHIRQTKNKTTPIRTHYRGERFFRWGKYDIGITMPDKHSSSQVIPISGHFDDDDNHISDEKLIEMEEVAKIINPYVEGSG